VLRADEVSFRYDEHGPWVLDGVSFAATPGQVTALRGPSGRGKTTLARLLAGYLSPQRGRVTLDDTPLPAHGLSPVQLVLQHPEHALDPRWRLGRSLAEAGPSDPRLLADLSIDEAWLTRYPNELSGGELQRLALARALAARPQVLIADEISVMLDAITQAQLWHTLLRHVREDGLTVVAISHDDELLSVVADEVHDLDATLDQRARAAA
jgi:ABC-type dipeptide/oligopeptide/nickel transport system ATPase subunit